MSIRKSPQTTGSDTRMYNHRSESDEFMYADEDDEKFGPGDPENRELLSREKKEKREEQQRKWVGLNHLKISTKNDEETPFEESTPQEEMTELSDKTGPVGSRGEDLDQAVGARTGTGSDRWGLPREVVYRGSAGKPRYSRESKRLN